MGYHEVTPHPALRPWVDRIWYGSFEPSAEPRVILPDGCIDIIVDVANEGRAIVVGTMTRAVVVDPPGATRHVAVRFRPGGAVPFLRASAGELTDREIDLHALGACWIALGSVRRDLPMSARRLERCLLERLDAVRAPDRALAHAVSAIYGRAPSPIEDIGRELGWTRQYLARRFRHDVGVSPKQLARIARLQRAVVGLQTVPEADLAMVAVRARYYDQAHMARDFRELAGVTPLRVRARAGSIRPMRSLLGGT